MDLMIAATALSLGVVLVTRNPADVDSLGVESDPLAVRRLARANGARSAGRRPRSNYHHYVTVTK